jgi:hypothetical protein
MKYRFPPTTMTPWAALPSPFIRLQSFASSRSGALTGSILFSHITHLLEILLL